MSFVGAVAASVRRVLAAYAGSVQGPALIVGAGNFTVPSVLRSGGYVGSIEACDVSLYTSALGAFLSGRDLPVQEAESCPEHLRGLLRTETSLDLAASVALLLDLRECWQLKNPFQERTFKTHVREWEALLAKTRDKLETFKAHVSPVDYEPMDGFEFLAGREGNETVFAFPPTYKRGYEKLEQLFGDVVTWQPPQYREMTDKSLELYEAIAGFDSYFVVLEKDMPDVRAILGDPVAVLPRGRGKTTWILARRASPKIIIRHTAKSAPVGPIWPADRRVDGAEEVSLVRLNLPQSLRLNELFLSKRVDYFEGGVSLSLGFALDGLLVGKADFAPSSHQWKLPEASPMIYVMCDLAVPSLEKRLAKLVLLLLLSCEVADALAERFMERFGWAITTAFSPHPVSMKYRGIFKLHTRKKTESGFSLNYFAALGQCPLETALTGWRKRFK